jgi:lipopolysaccharide assembly outer membrane protein LptD (OstA)
VGPHPARARTELVKYDAPSITFHVPQNRIVLEPKAHLTYREMELRAGRVEFDSDQQTLVANGHPELVDKGDRVTGNIMTYDLESRTGNIYQAETTYERGLYHGGQIRKSGENELDVKSGRYSTCDLPDPHYHFQAKYMKILLRDKMVAKPVVFYIKNVPLLALPFWVFPIKPGRHSGLMLPQVEFGFNNRQGQFIRNFGYYWAFNDYVDFTASGDFYQADPSWVGRFETVYRLLYKMDGIVQTSYRRSDNPQSPGDEWSFNADHSQELSPRTSIKARGEFVSSREYHRDPTYGSSLANRLDRFLVSNISLAHNADWASFSAYVDRRQDLDADQQLLYTSGPFNNLPPPPVGTQASLPSLTESTPNVSVSFPTRSVGGLPRIRDTGFGRAFASLYVTLNSSFASYHERRGVITGYRPVDTTFVDSTTVIGHLDDSRRAFTGAASLRDSRRAFGWLNVAPFFNGNLVVFDKDNLGNTIVPTGSWNSGVSGGTTFYGTFRTNVGPLVGFRHVVAPSIAYNYAPEFPNLFYTDSLGRTQSRFTGFPGASVSGFRQSNMSFSLSQRFQAKLQHGDRLERLDNLIAWDMSGSYNFLYKQQGLAHPLSSIGSSVRLQPPGLFTADASWLMDVYQPRVVRTLGYNLNLFLSGGRSRLSGPATATEVSGSAAGNAAFDVPWSLALAYSYQGGYAGPTTWSATKILNGVANVALTPNWRVEYLASYDVNTNVVLTQRYGLTRDLHCWQASFSRTFVINGEAEYYFRVGIKEQREIYLERGTRTQSFGGIGR